MQNTEAMLAVALAHMLEAAEAGRPPSDSATALAKKALETYMGPRLRDTVLTRQVADAGPLVSERPDPADYIPGGKHYRAARAVHPEDEKVGGDPGFGRRGDQFLTSPSDPL